MREKVEAALVQIRPALQADGGDVELVDVRDGRVMLRLTGALFHSAFRAWLGLLTQAVTPC